MKFYVENRNIYIEEDEYTGALFKLNYGGIAITKTIYNYEYYKKIFNKAYFQTFTEHRKDEQSKRIFYSEEDLLKPENEKLLFFIYKYLVEQKHELSAREVYMQAKIMVSTILLFILLKNEKIRIRLTEIISKKKHVQEFYKEDLCIENYVNVFNDIKLYKNKFGETLININGLQELVVINNSNILFRTYLVNGKDNIKIDDYELFFNNSSSNILWRIYKLLILRVNPFKTDSNRCMMGIYLLIALFKNKKYKKVIEEIKIKTKYKSDEEIIKKYKSLIEE